MSVRLPKSVLAPVLATALTLSALPALAGGLADPVIAPDVIIEDTTPNHSVIVPLMALLLLGVAAKVAH